ncbi:hypothetical protein llap_17747 [Limosa lapponica baueri]|uniref:Uncharacterized protein n=1 Tax=Limosa lapponica baueri TaxID=1758121 RepID=A0A2I0TDU8_LIMLA|nr:hypothetical protein llap_17747 [Limosa lapponica baueri]
MKSGGTQLKLIMTFQNYGQALFKPMKSGMKLLALDRDGTQDETFSLSPSAVFPPATAQRLLAGIWIGPSQPRRDLFSNSVSVFVK